MVTGIDDSHETSFSDGECDTAVANSIVWLVENRNLTSAAVAEKLGLSSLEWADISTGKTPLTLSLARRLAPLFGFSFVQFISHIESVLTGKTRAAIEIDVPHVGSKDTMRAFDNIYAGASDPDNQQALQFLMEGFAAKHALAAGTEDSAHNDNSS